MTSPGTSLLSSSEVADLGQLRLDGLATSIALSGVTLTLWRVDSSSGVPVALPPVVVARRFANRQPAQRGSEAAASSQVAGEFRAYAPWDVAPGDSFDLDPNGPGRIVPPITELGGMVTAAFVLDQGA